MLRQGIREISALQKYPIGMRYAEGDRVFRYCKADSALTEKWGAAMGDTLHETTVAVVAEAGDQDLTIDIVAGESYAKDQFKDGYLNIWTAVHQVCLKIKGNDASDGTYVVIHLEEPLLYDVAVDTNVDLHENPYKSVTTKRGVATRVYGSVVVIPIVPVTINYFFWGQTWGPVVGVAHADGGIGTNANERKVMFAADGSIGVTADVEGVDNQNAGFMLPITRTEAGVAGDDIFFMLQLSP